MDAGLDLAEAAWRDGSAPSTAGATMDCYVIHQVSSVHTSSLCERLGIDPYRVPLTFPTLGNVGPASVPITLARQARDAGRRGPRAVHGHRLRAEHLVHRDPLVSRRRRPALRAAPAAAGPARARPAVVAARRGRRLGRRAPAVARAGHHAGRPAADRATARHAARVHGNPTWSYLWRPARRAAPTGWRVVAVDHLDMGFSERTGVPAPGGPRARPRRAHRRARPATGRWSRSPTTGAARSRSAGRWTTATSSPAWC